MSLRKKIVSPKSYVILGCAFLLSSIFIPKSVDFLKSKYSLTDENFVIYPLNYLQEYAFEAGILGITFSILILFINYWAEMFWAEHIKPIFVGYVNKITESTDEAKEAIDSFKQDVSEKIRENNLDLALAHSGYESLHNRLPAIYEKVFGEHCSKEKGLYSAMFDGVGGFLDPRVPHRSNYYQEINITEEGGKVVWQESTKYSLHTIALDNEYKTPFDGDIEPYVIKHVVSARYEDLNTLALEILVEDKVVISTAGKLSVTKNADGLPIFSSSDENISGHVDSEGVTIKVSCAVSISKPMTRIEVVEKSILTDSHFMSHVSQPTYDLTSHITLPDGWVFEFFHVPDSTWLGPKQKASKQSVRKGGWVMPGMFLCCRWQAGVKSVV
jgi:hypothetical protein